MRVGIVVLASDRECVDMLGRWWDFIGMGWQTWRLQNVKSYKELVGELVNTYLLIERVYELEEERKRIEEKMKVLERWK
jgi:hypothetical protein